MISYLKKRKFQSLLTSHPNYRYRANATLYNQGERVCIISNVQYRSEVEQFVKSTIGKEITCIYFSPTKEETDLEDVYTLKNLSWAQIPTGINIDQFLQKEYDRLYYLDTQMEKHQLYLYLLAKSKFSIGPLLEQNIESFDLSIELKKMSITTLLSEIKKSLTLLSQMV